MKSPRAPGALLVLCLLPCLLPRPARGQAWEQEEREFGYYADRMVAVRSPFVLAPDVERRIAEIGHRVAAAVSLPDGPVSGGTDYTFRVVNDATINAFAAAAGHIYVTSGLLDILESEDELAAVLGHEIAHSAESHQLAALHSAHSSARKGKVAGFVIGAVLSVVVAGTAPSDMSTQQVSRLMDLGYDVGEAAGQSLAYSMVLGFGREQELAADSIGATLAARAGYDPAALITVFRRMAGIRDRLGLTSDRYASGLIHADPGLEERIDEAERRGGGR